MQNVHHTESGRKHWFRFYNEALDDPKVQRLPSHLFRTWVNLLCLASQSNGNLPSIDDIAFRLRLSVQDAESHMSDLILAGLIDITESGRIPHNWSKRQFASDTSAERTRKYRDRKRKMPCDVTCDGEVTVQIQSRADTEQNRSDQTDRAEAREPDRPAADQDQNFSDCKQAFNGTTEAMLSEVMAAMHPYGDRKGAASWLATTMRTNGAKATAQAFQMLATAKAEGQPIARVLPWWAKTAASLKAKPPPEHDKPQKHWRDERNERARKICQMAMEASHG